MEDEQILLRIKRMWSKEEAVNALMVQLKEADIKNGILLSEIAELKDEVEKLRQIPTSNRKTKRQWLQDEIVKEVTGNNKKLVNTNSDLVRQLVILKDKYVSLLAQSNLNK